MNLQTKRKLQTNTRTTTHSRGTESSTATFLDRVTQAPPAIIYKSRAIVLLCYKKIKQTQKIRKSDAVLSTRVLTCEYASTLG